MIKTIMNWMKTQTEKEHFRSNQDKTALDSHAARSYYGKHFKFTPSVLNFVAVYPHWVPCK